LIDIIIINKYNQELVTSVEDLGLSVLLAQILSINSGKGNMRNKIVLRR
jgi:hypothetical protein